jgi:chorismate-pyruvate lyase
MTGQVPPQLIAVATISLGRLMAQHNPHGLQMFRQFLLVTRTPLVLRDLGFYTGSIKGDLGIKQSIN